MHGFSFHTFLWAVPKGPPVPGYTAGGRAATNSMPDQVSLTCWATAGVTNTVPRAAGDEDWLGRVRGPLRAAHTGEGHYLGGYMHMPGLTHRPDIAAGPGGAAAGYEAPGTEGHSGTSPLPAFPEHQLRRHGPAPHWPRPLPTAS